MKESEESINQDELNKLYEKMVNEVSYSTEERKISADVYAMESYDTDLANAIQLYINSIKAKTGKRIKVIFYRGGLLVKIDGKDEKRYSKDTFLSYLEFLINFLE